MSTCASCDCFHDGGTTAKMEITPVFTMRPRMCTVRCPEAVSSSSGRDSSRISKIASLRESVFKMCFDPVTYDTMSTRSDMMQVSSMLMTGFSPTLRNRTRVSEVEMLICCITRMPMSMRSALQTRNTNFGHAVFPGEYLSAGCGPFA